MALTRQQKETQVADLTEKMKNASSVIFTQYLGLTVTAITKLRSSLKKEKAEMKVAKKTLVRLAAKNANIAEISEEQLPADVACIFSFDEPTTGASIAHKFAKDHAQIKLLGGIFSGKILTKNEAMEFATIPSKIQLIGMFMSMCNTPLTQFASACGGPLTGFARALSEISKKKASEAPAPVAAAVTPEVAAAPAAPEASAPAAAATPSA